MTENARSYLYGLAPLARVFQNKSHMERLNASVGLSDFRRAEASFRWGVGSAEAASQSIQQLDFEGEASKIARKGANCTTVLVFGDTFGGGVEVGTNFQRFQNGLDRARHL